LAGADFGWAAFNDRNIRGAGGFGSVGGAGNPPIARASVDRPRFGGEGLELGFCRSIFAMRLQ
jgi:hypothetical protein